MWVLFLFYLFFIFPLNAFGEVLLPIAAVSWSAVVCLCRCSIFVPRSSLLVLFDVPFAVDGAVFFYAVQSASRTKKKNNKIIVVSIARIYQYTCMQTGRHMHMQPALFLTYTQNPQPTNKNTHRHSHKSLYINNFALNTPNYPSIIWEWLSTTRKNAVISAVASAAARMQPIVWYWICYCYYGYFCFKFRLSEQFNGQSTHNWIWALLRSVSFSLFQSYFVSFIRISEWIDKRKVPFGCFINDLMISFHMFSIYSGGCVCVIGSVCLSRQDFMMWPMWAMIIEISNESIEIAPPHSRMIPGRFSFHCSLGSDK